MTLKDLASEILSGLEGVTPGPWDTEADLPYGYRPRVEFEAKIVCVVGNSEFSAQDEWKANAAHIAICSPDNMRAICERLVALETENERLHSIEVALEAGKPRNADQWKVLFISGHAVATNTPGEVIPGLEGEFVAIRESSATMGVGRASSLIDYTLAYMANHNIKPHKTKYMGYAA